MLGVIIAAATVTAIGLVCGLILVIASKFMEVKEDPRIAEIRACLPGANCGACGFTGCDGYAKAIVETEGTKTNLCTPGGSASAKRISEVLGTEFKDTEKLCAYVHCHGDCKSTHTRFDYEGISSCAATKMLFSGNWSCPHGCLGYGDCAEVCPGDAITIKDGVAHINPNLCSGCGLCAKTCPNALISLHSAKKMTVVECNSTQKGAITRAACSSGCIGCKKCEKACPEGAVTVQNNLAVIDEHKCTGCGLCTEACPVSCIKFADFSLDGRCII